MVFDLEHGQGCSYERKEGCGCELEHGEGCDCERKERKEAMVDHCRESFDLGFLPFF